MTTKQSHQYGQLEKLIVSTLSSGQSLVVSEILKRLQTDGSRYSVQAIYHVLRKLQRSGVVLKFKKKYSLSINWALDLLDLAKQIEHRLLKTVPAVQVIPELNKQLRWRFTNLLALDDFWVQVMLLLLERTRGRDIYNFCPHPWFYYAQQSKLDKFYRVLRRRNSRVYVVVGGNTILDRLFIKAMSPELYTTIHSSGESVGGGIDKHVMVIGEYVITVYLPKPMALALNDYFMATSKNTMTEFHELQSIMKTPTKARLTILHNPIKAHRLRGHFVKLFE